MKTINLFRIGILSLFAMAFFACQKNELKTPALTSELKAVNNTNSNGPTDATLGLDFSNNPFVVGVPTTITFTSTPTLSCGEARIEVNVDASGNPTYDGSSGTWKTLASSDLSSAAYPTYVFIPTQAGQLTFRAQYVPQGGCGYHAPQYVVFRTVIQQCVTGLFASISNATNTGVPDAKGNPTFQITVSYNVQNCTNNYSGKLQGGLIDGATVISISDGGYIKPSRTGNGAPVIVWDNVPTGVYTVTYQVSRPAGVLVPITGQWTYSVNDAIIYTADALNFNFQ